MNNKSQPYETAIAYISRCYFIKERPEEGENDILTLIAFLYEKDELRVIADINNFWKKEEERYEKEK
jgi:hypothetical protein